MTDNLYSVIEINPDENGQFIIEPYHLTTIGKSILKFQGRKIATIIKQIDSLTIRIKTTRSILLLADINEKVFEFETPGAAYFDSLLECNSSTKITAKALTLIGNYKTNEIVLNVDKEVEIAGYITSASLNLNAELLTFSAIDNIQSTLNIQKKCNINIQELKIKPKAYASFTATSASTQHSVIIQKNLILATGSLFKLNNFMLEAAFLNQGGRFEASTSKITIHDSFIQSQLDTSSQLNTTHIFSQRYILQNGMFQTKNSTIDGLELIATQGRVVILKSSKISLKEHLRVSQDCHLIAKSSSLNADVSISCNQSYFRGVVINTKVFKCLKGDFRIINTKINTSEHIYFSKESILICDQTLSNKSIEFNTNNCQLLSDKQQGHKLIIKTNWLDIESSTASYHSSLIKSKYLNLKTSKQSLRIAFVKSTVQMESLKLQGSAYFEQSTLIDAGKATNSHSILGQLQMKNAKMVTKSQLYAYEGSLIQLHAHSEVNVGHFHNKGNLVTDNSKIYLETLASFQAQLLSRSSEININKDFIGSSAHIELSEKTLFNVKEISVKQSAISLQQSRLQSDNSILSIDNSKLNASDHSAVITKSAMLTGENKFNRSRLNSDELSIYDNLTVENGASLRVSKNMQLESASKSIVDKSQIKANKLQNFGDLQAGFSQLDVENALKNTTDSHTTLQASQLKAGELLHRGHMLVKSEKLKEASITVPSTINIKTNLEISPQGEITGDSFSIESHTIENQGVIKSTDSVTISGQTLINDSSIQADKQLNLNFDGMITNYGELDSSIVKIQSLVLANILGIIKASSSFSCASLLDVNLGMLSSNLIQVDSLFSLTGGLIIPDFEQGMSSILTSSNLLLAARTTGSYFLPGPLRLLTHYSVARNLYSTTNQLYQIYDKKGMTGIYNQRPHEWISLACHLKHAAVASYQAYNSLHDIYNMGFGYQDGFYQTYNSLYHVYDTGFNYLDRINQASIASFNRHELFQPGSKLSQLFNRANDILLSAAPSYNEDSFLGTRALGLSAMPTSNYRSIFAANLRANETSYRNMNQAYIWQYAGGNYHTKKLIFNGRDLVFDSNVQNTDLNINLTNNLTKTSGSHIETNHAFIRAKNLYEQGSSYLSSPESDIRLENVIAGTDSNITLDNGLKCVVENQIRTDGKINQTNSTVQCRELIEEKNGKLQQNNATLLTDNVQLDGSGESINQSNIIVKGTYELSANANRTFNDSKLTASQILIDGTQTLTNQASSKSDLNVVGQQGKTILENKASDETNIRINAGIINVDDSHLKTNEVHIQQSTGNLTATNKADVKNATYNQYGQTTICASLLENTVHQLQAGGNSNITEEAIHKGHEFISDGITDYSNSQQNIDKIEYSESAMDTKRDTNVVAQHIIVKGLQSETKVNTTTTTYETTASSHTAKVDGQVNASNMTLDGTMHHQNAKLISENDLLLAKGSHFISNGDTYQSKNGAIIYGSQGEFYGLSKFEAKQKIEGLTDSSMTGSGGVSLNTDELQISETTVSTKLAHIQANNIDINDAIHARNNSSKFNPTDTIDIDTTGCKVIDGINDSRNIAIKADELYILDNIKTTQHLEIEAKVSHVHIGERPPDNNLFTNDEITNSNITKTQSSNRNLLRKTFELDLITNEIDLASKNVIGKNINKVKTQQPSSRSNSGQKNNDKVTKNISTIFANRMADIKNAADRSKNKQKIPQLLIEGKNTVITAKQDINIVKGSIAKGSNHISVCAERDVQLINNSETYQGQFDIEKEMTPSQILGGAGEDLGEYTGIGVNVYAGNKVIVQASDIVSTGSNLIKGVNGIDIKQDSHHYIKNVKESGNLLKEKVTVTKTTDIAGSNIVSTTGENTLISEKGAINAVATKFVALKGNYGEAKGDIHLYEAVGQHSTQTKKSFIGGLISGGKTTLSQEYAEGVVFIDKGNTELKSLSGSIHATGVQSYNPTGPMSLIAENGDVSYNPSILNHSYKETKVSISFNNPTTDLMTKLSKNSSAHEILQVDPATRDIANVLEPNSITGHLLASANASMTTYNLGQDYKEMGAQGIAMSHLGLGDASGFNPTVTATFGKNDTTINFQTTSDSVINRKTLKIVAKDTVDTSGTLIDVDNGNIKANKWIHDSVQLEQDINQRSTAVSVSVDLAGNLSGGVIEQKGSSHSTHYQNKPAKFKDNLTMDVDKWMIGGSIETNTIAGRADELTIISHQDTSSSESKSTSVHTSGDVSASHSQSSEKVTNNITLLHVEEGINHDEDQLKVKKLILVGGQITTNGQNNLEPEVTIVTHNYDTRKVNNIGISTNINRILPTSSSVKESTIDEDNNKTRSEKNSSLFNVITHNEAFAAVQQATFSGKQDNFALLNTQGDTLNHNSDTSRQIIKDKTETLDMRAYNLSGFLKPPINNIPSESKNMVEFDILDFDLEQSSHLNSANNLVIDENNHHESDFIKVLPQGTFNPDVNSQINNQKQNNCSINTDRPQTVTYEDGMYSENKNATSTIAEHMTNSVEFSTNKFNNFIKENLKDSDKLTKKAGKAITSMHTASAKSLQGLAKYEREKAAGNKNAKSDVAIEMGAEYLVDKMLKKLPGSGAFETIVFASSFFKADEKTEAYYNNQIAQDYERVISPNATLAEQEIYWDRIDHNQELLQAHAMLSAPSDIYDKTVDLIKTGANKVWNEWNKEDSKPNFSLPQSSINDSINNLPYSNAQNRYSIFNTNINHNHESNKGREEKPESNQEKSIISSFKK